MAKGENIFRRRDGRWEARYIKGRELSGKIKYGYCYGKTYREAKVKAAKHKAALENGVLLPTATTQKQFSSYCLEWLHTKKCTVKESTYIKYSTVVNKHIMPKLGECCPLGFTTELMDNFIKELQFEADDFTAYFDAVQAQKSLQSNFRTDAWPEPGDRVLTLSTCFRGDNHQRYLVQGKLVAEAYAK